MDQRESTDGCLNCEGVPTDGCSQLYVGDIEIIFENVSAIQISHDNKYEYLVAASEEPRSNSPSPLELQEERRRGGSLPWTILHWRVFEYEWKGYPRGPYHTPWH